MACQKTVVDFTLMSDAEIIQYFSKASGSVCGRVGSDQLNRRLVAPRPPRKSPWIGWPVLLSGLLFTSDEAGAPRVRKTEVTQCSRPKLGGQEEVRMGAMAVMRPDTSAIEQLGERHEVVSAMEEVGAIVVVEPPEDTVHVGERREVPDSMVYNGGITVTEPPDDDTSRVTVDSVTIRRALTRWSRNIFDTVTKIVADSLAVVGIKTSDAADRAEIKEERGAVKSEAGEATVYPNPVLRGASLNLLWKKEAEDGRANLYSIGGALVQSWMIQGGSTTRMLTMPADIAAGVYILQVITKDGGYTRKVVVE